MKYKTPDNSRMAALYFFPRIQEADKQYMDKQFMRLLYCRRTCEILGILPMVGHLAQNRWKPNPVTISLLMVPWLTGVLVNLAGHLYLDHKFDRMRLYSKYSIN